jgi:hypothetical protein
MISFKFLARSTRYNLHSSCFLMYYAVFSCLRNKIHAYFAFNVIFEMNLAFNFHELVIIQIGNYKARHVL